MPKIPDFSKFDIQSIVNSVKTMINPEAGTPDVTEGDPIGTKIVEISTLLQSVSHSQQQMAQAHEQSGKDLNKINTLMNALYKDLEQFRKLEAELHQRAATPDTTTDSSVSNETTGRTSTPPTGDQSKPTANDIPPKDKL